MSKRTERDFQISLVKLLNRVRVQNDWSSKSFHAAATHVVNVTSAEAVRFYKAMVNSNLITVASDHRKSRPNFDVNAWKNDDIMLDMIREVLETAVVMKNRGRIAGVSPRRREKIVVEEAVIVEQEDVVEDFNPLLMFSDKELADELRRRYPSIEIIIKL